MKRVRGSIAALALLALSGAANAQTDYLMTFDTDALGNPIADGTTIDTEYAAWGVNYFPDALFLAGTDLTATNSDVGVGYDASFGNVLHSFTGWLSEFDDPSILLTFDNPVVRFSADILGDASGSSAIALFDANSNLINFVFTDADGTSAGVESLALTTTADLPAFFGVILPGSFGDWAAADNVRITVVPEPGSAALAVSLGVAGLGALVRRRRARA